MKCGILDGAIGQADKKKLVENLVAGRHGDSNGLYLVVDLNAWAEATPPILLIRLG